MATRAIKVYNATTSVWEDVAIAQPDTSAFVNNSLVTAANQLISSSGSGVPVAIAIENDQSILSSQVFG